MDVEKHLLIVDRSDLVVQALCLAVEAQGTWKVTPSLNSGSVPSLMRTNPVSVILMGYRIDGSAGLNLAKDLRSMGFNQSIVLMSGCVRDIDRTEAARLGIRWILAKPFGLALIYRVIEESYRESMGGAHSRIDPVGQKKLP